MDLDSADSFNILRQLIPLLVSLLDDVLIVGLSRLGCNLPYLEWLSPIVITGTIVYLSVQFWQSPFGARKFNELRQKFEQKVLET